MEQCTLFGFYPGMSTLSENTGRGCPAGREGAESPLSGWPAEVREVAIPCSDGKEQPSLWFCPPGHAPKPLLVGLHTWSSNFKGTSGEELYAKWCIKQGWAFLHPDFRGPNTTAEAMGSGRAVRDLVEAVVWAQNETPIDSARIYLVGVSGGGHMALLMAGRHPEIWAGVSAWCGISDIAQWHADHTKNGIPDGYAKNIEAALGGSPECDPACRKAAWERSPLASLAAAKMPLDINSGFSDGRKGSVPFLHGLRAFNSVAAEADQLDEAEMTQYYLSQKLPDGWSEASPDPVYARWKPLFRRTSGNARITIFDGGHEIVHQAALNWLALQRKGFPAQWEVKSFQEMEIPGSESGK